MRVGGTALTDRVLVGGGGGGGGSCRVHLGPAADGGPGGGLTGGAGSTVCDGGHAFLGQGGTQTAGGAGSANAGSGTFGAGGKEGPGLGFHGCTVDRYGSGGGGGDCSDGGGGGSGHGPAGTIFQTGVRSGDGQVVISFTQPVTPPTPTDLTTTPPGPANNNNPLIRALPSRARRSVCTPRATAPARRSPPARPPTSPSPA